MLDIPMKNLHSNKILSGQAKSTAKQFSLRHVFRAGAIVWCKHKGKDYYVVFRSLSRPNRGVQIPRGLIERDENLGEAVVREVKEETGIDSRIVCPLGYIFFENPTDNYSNLQMYYIVRPTTPVNVNDKWSFVDTDGSDQQLEVWCEPAMKDPNFLAAGQSQVVKMFQKWLKEHKKPSPKFYKSKTSYPRETENQDDAQSLNGESSIQEELPKSGIPIIPTEILE